MYFSSAIKVIKLEINQAAAGATWFIYPKGVATSHINNNNNLFTAFKIDGRAMS